ncbi:MAG: hypothetical protein RLZZ350_2491 [Verrucomicrobiota bacterium]
MNFSKLRARVEQRVPLLVGLICAGVALLIPLQIIKLGYLPPDDALRYAARAMTGRAWSDVLVFGNPNLMDHNFGWNALLRGLELATHLDVEMLVVLPVVFLFALVSWAGMVSLRRPETWLAVLVMASVGAGFHSRLMSGRPLLLTMAALLTVLMCWQRREGRAPGCREVGLMLGVIAAVCFTHGCWYLWAVVGLAFALAQQWRWAWAFGGSWAGGTVLAGIFTGHPVEFLWDAVDTLTRAFGGHETQRTMQSEFQPAQGDVIALIFLLGLCGLRALTRPNLPPVTRNPAFWLTVICWTLGFKATRFWVDWGWPALMIFAATELQAWWTARVTEKSLERLAATVGLALMTLLAISNDNNNRWTWNLGLPFLTPDEPRLAGWLPDDGGIIYSSDMQVYYRTFFKNPTAKWRYMLGDEPAFMPDDDFKIYQAIIANEHAPEKFRPWIAKLKPADRLVIRADSAMCATYPELDWNLNAGPYYIARLRSVKTPVPAK